MFTTSLILAPRVLALCALEELRWRLVAAARLDEPVICLAVAAFCALLVCCRQIWFVVLDNDYVFFLFFFCYLNFLGHCMLAAATAAFHSVAARHQHAAAFAELDFEHSMKLDAIVFIVKQQKKRHILLLLTICEASHNIYRLFSCFTI